MQLILIVLACVCWSLEPRSCVSSVDVLSRRGSIYFEDSDISVSIITPNGKKIAEAFNATNGVKEPRKMRWVSLGLPTLLISKDQLNISKNAALKFVSGGFYIFIKTLSSEVAQELAKEASLKYESDILMSQFFEIDKHIGSVECSLDLFVNDSVGFIKLVGSAAVIANPIVVFFKLPSPVNSYVKIIRNETDPFIFRCNIELHGKSLKQNNFQIQSIKDSNSIEEHIGGAHSGILVNGSNYRLLKTASGAEKTSAVFTEQISLTTEDFRVTDIVSECAAAIKASALSEFNAVLNATASIRDSMNQSLTAMNQIARNTSTRIDCAFAMATRQDYMITMLQGANLSTCSGYSIPGGHSFALFTTNATFTVPPGIYSVRALAVGGGAGGASCYGGGGGSGYVRFGQFAVTPLTQIKVTVGRGGRGSTMKMYDAYQNGGGGGRSAFGNILIADGGLSIITAYCSTGGNGGSGGGGGWISYTSRSGSSGAGGADGDRGNNSASGQSGGTGQGTFSVGLWIFTNNTFTAGSGGASATGSNIGGGGGGGVLMNGDGPSGGTGQYGDTFGGNGYGAGGAGGKHILNDNLGNPCYAGGDGADGLVYVEW